MRRLLCGDADSGGPALVVRDSSICVRKTRMVVIPFLEPSACPTLRHSV